MTLIMLLIKIVVHSIVHNDNGDNNNDPDDAALVVAVVLRVVRAQGAFGARLDAARAGEDLPHAVVARRRRRSRRRRGGVELRVDPVADVVDSRPDPRVRLGLSRDPERHLFLYHDHYTCCL